MKPTPAGLKILRNFVEAEQLGRLTEFTTLGGDKFQALTLPGGDGALKAAAEKLNRDGFGRAYWVTRPYAPGVRFFLINDAGREALK